MIVNDELLAKLRRLFNLNLYEVKIWVALISRKISTAGELSDIAKVPRSRAYDILESLENKGFIIMKLDKPIKYISVDPEDVVERYKKHIIENADKTVERLNSEDGVKTIQDLSNLYNKGVDKVSPQDLAGSIKGRNNIYNQIDSMLKKANEDITIITNETGLIRKLDSMTSILKQVKEKGVNIKIAVHSEQMKEVSPALREIADVKTNDDVDARLCVVDGKDVMFMLMNDKEIHPNYDVGVWVNSPLFGKALRTMFNNSVMHQ